MIEFYVSKETKEKTKKKKLILLDEIDNFLHPNYINFISKIIIKMFENNDYFVIITTHNPELLFLLNEYIEYLATPKLNEEKNYEINYIDLKLGFNEYKKFLSETIKKKFN